MLKRFFFKCNKCDLTFDEKRNIKMHNMSRHAKTLKCEHCDETFQLNWRLETHLKTHKQSKKFECDKCGKVFLLKWRLEQHKKTHALTNIKYFHYFNNMKRNIGQTILFKKADRIFHRNENRIWR